MKAETGTCVVCGLKIRRIEEPGRPWMHDDLEPPVHAPRPIDDDTVGFPTLGWPS